MTTHWAYRGFDNMGGIISGIFGGGDTQQPQTSVQQAAALAPAVPVATRYGGTQQQQSDTRYVPKARRSTLDVFGSGKSGGSSSLGQSGYSSITKLGMAS